jgi:DNA modification methylase
MDKINLDDLMELLDAPDVDTGARRIPPRFRPTYSKAFEIPVTDIIVKPDRQRGGKLEGKPDGFEQGEMLEGLDNSIDELGFWGDIKVCKYGAPEGKYILVMNARSFLVLVDRGAETVSCKEIFLHPEDPNPEATLEILEYYEDAIRLDRDSINKMKTRARIYKRKKAAGQEDEEIARGLRMSPQALSDTKKNNEFFENHPDKVKHCRNPDQIRDVRYQHERAEKQRNLEELNRLMGITKPEPKYLILTANFIKWADEYQGEPFDLIHWDGPYGIGQDKFNQSSKTLGRYRDSPEIHEALFSALLNFLPRLLSPNGVLVCWHAKRNEEDIRQRARKMGLYVPEYPFIWVKPNEGIAPRAGLDLRQCWEQALVCSRGNPGITEKQNWFGGPGPDTHQSGKNEAMLEHLFSAIVNSTSRVLDPTCGSGVAIRVGKKLGVAYALGLEIDENFALLARAALEAEK